MSLARARGGLATGCRPEREPGRVALGVGRQRAHAQTLPPRRLGIQSRPPRPGGTMTSRASRRAAVAAGVAGALFVVWLLVPGTRPAGPGDELEPGRAGPEVQEELSEQTDARLEALSEANARGIRWQIQGSPAGTPAPGWVGEQAIDPAADDWEPAIAADPSAPFVYLMTTHFVDKPCPGNCPVPHISLHVSSDGGKTWGVATTSLRVQGVLAVRSGGRGRPEHRGGVRGLPRWLQRCVYALGGPRQDVVRLP